MESVSFKAAFETVKTDREGESKVTFVVPLSDLSQCQSLAQMFGKLLTVEVTEDDTF